MKANSLGLKSVYLHKSLSDVVNILIIISSLRPRSSITYVVSITSRSLIVGSYHHQKAAFERTVGAEIPSLFFCVVV